jgi:adenylosuccinate synthase
VVRTGSINAGHNVYLPDGTKYAFQQIPTGSIIRDMKVVIGPGAYVNQHIITAEMDVADCWHRTILDANCGVHLDEYTSEAAKEQRNIRIGATGKGCAEAIVHKIRDRGLEKQKPLLLRDRWSDDAMPTTADTPSLLTEVYHRGEEKIQIEGTQGSLLDFHLGPYPFVTSRQTISSAWVTEAGLSPAFDYEVVLVVRTYPIRVAGNSGPMYDEINWPTLADRMNRRLADAGFEPLVNPSSIHEFDRYRDDCVNNMKQRGLTQSEIKLKADTEALSLLCPEDLEEVRKLFEMTTVTKRLRRIAGLDVMQVKKQARLEGAKYIVLTFLNYVFPELYYRRVLTDEMLEYVAGLQQAFECHIKYVTIGPKSEDMVEVFV